MASFHNRSLIGAALVASTFAFAACGESGPSGNTSLSIRLKDAPSELQKAVVTISEVDLVGSNGTIVLSSTPVTVDLLTLATQTMDLVKDATVPSGTYTQLRFKISGAYIETGTPGVTTSIYATSPTYAGLPAGTQVTGELQTPSFEQSGLKVTFQDNALDIEGDQKILLVDFDVAQSFGHAAGQSDKWVMHPVITGGTLTASGGVHVTAHNAQGITFALSTANATLTDANGAALGTPHALTDANSDGTYEADFGFLGAGSYKVSIVPAQGSITTDPVSPRAVTVTAGQSTTVDFTVNAAQ